MRCCLAPLQSNIFTNDKDVQVLSVVTHNHNATGYSKNDLKEIRYRNEAAHESSVRDFMHKKIVARPYDCIDSA